MDAPAGTWTLIIAAVVALGTVWSARSASRSATAATLAVEAQREIGSRQADVTRELGRLQTWASVVSASRQRWIDAMREDVAEFLTLDASYKGFDRNPSRDEAENIRAYRAAHDLLRQQMLILKRVRLRMNPAEDDHAELYGLMKSLLGKDQEQSAEVAELIVSLTQVLLKLEWDRVRFEAAGELPPNVKPADQASQPLPSVRTDKTE